MLDCAPSVRDSRRSREFLCGTRSRDHSHHRHHHRRRGGFIFSALMTDGPTRTGTPIDRPSPDEALTEISLDAWNGNREYGLQATAFQDGGSAGTSVTSSWTNPNTPEWGSVIAAVAVLSASGGGGALQITDFTYPENTNEVILTWPRTGAPFFAVTFHRSGGIRHCGRRPFGRGLR